MLTKFVKFIQIFKRVCMFENVFISKNFNFNIPITQNLQIY